MWQGKYFANLDFTNEILTRNDGATLDFDSSIAGKQGFNDPVFVANERKINGTAVIWTGVVRPFFAETYTFSIEVDNAVEILIDGVSVFTGFVPNNYQTLTFTHQFNDTDAHDVAIRYKNTQGEIASNVAHFKLEWQSASQTKQLVGEYSNGRLITQALKKHFSRTRNTPAYLWLVEPKKGEVEGYTAHDRDIVYNPDPKRFSAPILFRSVGGLSPSEIPASVGLASESADVFLLLNNMTRARIMTKYYEAALGTIMVVNYENLSQGHVTLMGGRLRTADVDIPKGVTFKLSSWSDLLQQPVGRKTGPVCPWHFMYGHCRGNTNGFDEIDPTMPDDGPKPTDPYRTQTGAIEAIFSNSHLKLSGFNATHAPDTWAQNGFLKLVGGEYDGAQFEIQSWKATGEIYLSQPLPVLPEIGYSVSVEEGCEHTIDDCKYPPAFGGQPYAPTEETLTASTLTKN